MPSSQSIEPLADIRALQRQGRLQEAIAACQQASAHQDDPVATALLGTLHCQNQDFDAGRACLERALADEHRLAPAALIDIAGIFLLLGEPAKAWQHLDRALALEPQSALARARRGMAYMQLGQFREAVLDFAQGLEHCLPVERLPLHINLARCALQLADPETALGHVEQAGNLGGAANERWLAAAVDAYSALNRWADAEQAVQRAWEAGVAKKHCAGLLALVLAAQDRHGEAEQPLRAALREDPDDVDLLMRLSALAAAEGRHGLAVQCIRAALKAEPENASLWSQLARQNKRCMDDAAARQAAEKAMALTTGDTGLKRAEALVSMAGVEIEAGLAGQAEAHYRQALALVPGYAPAQMGLGHWLLEWGRIEEALAHFEAAAARGLLAGHGALIRARHFPDDPALLARLEKTAYIPGLQGSISSALLFDLAAAYEQRRDYEKAFRLASEANAAVRKRIGYSADKYRERCAALMRAFDAGFFAARPDYGNPSRLPVFVLGMPRSGTTLVEQILGGHPDIFGAGEIGVMAAVIQKLNAWERHAGSGLCYPACIHDLTAPQSRAYAEEVLAELRAYAPKASHVVDKLPHNFENIGLIRLLFPNAPIIHVLREPRDVALSNFFADYLAKFGGLGFAYDLADLGKHLRDYQRLMAHWGATLPTPILTVRYEEIVDDTEAMARAILSYIGVPWTDQVLAYQTLNRAVKTASVWQVRQPIYQTSKGKWQRYQAHLGPLEAALAEVLPSPGSAEPHPPPGLFFAGMEHLQAGRSEQAAAAFEAVLRHNPLHAAATHMLGVALMRQGKPEAALALMQDSIARHGGHPGWHHNLGRVLDALGRHPEAQAAYQAAQTLKRPFAQDLALNPRWFGIGT